MAMLDGMQPCVNMDMSAGVLVPDFSHPQPRTFDPSRAEVVDLFADLYGVPISDVESMLDEPPRFVWEEVRLDKPCPPRACPARALAQELADVDLQRCTIRVSNAGLAAEPPHGSDVECEAAVGDAETVDSTPTPPPSWPLHQPPHRYEALPSSPPPPLVPPPFPEGLLPPSPPPQAEGDALPPVPDDGATLGEPTEEPALADSDIALLQREWSLVKDYNEDRLNAEMDEEQARHAAFMESLDPDMGPADSSTTVTYTIGDHNIGSVTNNYNYATAEGTEPAPQVSNGKRSRTYEPVRTAPRAQDRVQQTRAMGMVHHGLQTEIGSVRPDDIGVAQLDAMLKAEQRELTKLRIDPDTSSVDSDAPQCVGCTNPLHPLCPHARCGNCCTGLGCGVHQSKHIEIVVEVGGEVVSFPVDPAVPLRETVLVHDLHEGYELFADGNRVTTALSARVLRFTNLTVLQAFPPQQGGGFEEDEMAMEAEEADPRALELNDTHAGQNAARRAESEQLVRQILQLPQDPAALLSLSGIQIDAPVRAGDVLTGDALAAAKRAYLRLACRVHPDKLLGCADATAAFQAVEAAWKRVSDATAAAAAAAADADADAAADDDDDDDDDEDESYNDEDEDSEEEEEDDGDESYNDEEEDSEEEEDDDWYDESAGRRPQAQARGQRRRRQQQQAQHQAQQQQQQQQQAQQGRQTRAQDASECVARFHEQQRERVRPPDIADTGLQPWDDVRVELACVEASKVLDFDAATTLRTKIRTLRSERNGQTALLPTQQNTLLIEAGCSAEKTRKLIAWLKQLLAIDPDMPVLFVTTRKTHADDLAATLKANGIDGFVCYLDAKQSDVSKKEFLSTAKRAIVSMQSLGSVDVDLYRNGVIVMDEVRSLAAIPGGGTLDGTTQLPGIMEVLKMLCTQAKYRIAMDADVSADGAVRDWLRCVAPRSDVLHVQLRQAALRRELHYGFTELMRDKCIMQMRQKLALHRARKSRERAMEGEAGHALRGAALAVIGSLLGLVRGGQFTLPVRKDGGARDAPTDHRTVSKGLAFRTDATAFDFARFAWASVAMDCAKRRVSRLIERVFVIGGRPGQTDQVVHVADEVGARVPVDEGKYFGKGSDATKRAHFKDTSKAWFWADTVVATSTLSVGVNVRIHFACCFLYTFPGTNEAKLRELLQGIVRVGRDADDPLTDERIFVLISGKAPTLDFDPRPQPARHAEVLAGMTSAAVQSRKSAATAKAKADARLEPEGMPPPEAEEALSDPLQSLLAWGTLEAQDNVGKQHAIKLIELCKLPTRDWSVHRMEDVPEDEKQALANFDEELKQRGGAAARLAPEDGRVGAMSAADRYDWLNIDLQREADANGTTLDREKANFIAEQEALFASKTARPEKDCRDQVREEVYNVVRHFTPNACQMGSDWPADGEKYAKLRPCIEPLLLRAQLSEIPPDDLAMIHEAQRREGKTAHAQVKAPPFQRREWLCEFADVLGERIECLLLPTTFKPTCDADADRLQPGPQCCASCDGSCSEWLRWHNRGRANVGGDGVQQQRDAERRQRLCELAKKLGVKGPTARLQPLALVGLVLRDVLALGPPKGGELKVYVDAAHGRRLQVVEPWAVTDEFAEHVRAIQLPMLHPETMELISVRASDWVDEFERLTGDLLSDAGGYDPMLSDAEGDDDVPMGEADAAGSSSGVGDGARAFDPMRKTFKVDLRRLRETIVELEADAPAVATAKAEIGDRLAELRNEAQGEVGDFRAAFVLLRHPDEPKVLMAREECDQYGERRGPLVRKLNPLGGKRMGNESARATAARVAAEETAGELSGTAKRQLRDGTGTTGVWDERTSAYVFVHQLANPQDLFLNTSVPARHSGHEQLLGVEWVPLANLQDPAWCEEHCHRFCQSQLAAARPLLQNGHGGHGGDVVAAQKERAQEIKELDALHKDLARHDSLLNVAKGMEARCEGAPVDANGWAELTDTYSYRGTGGRRYVDGYAVPHVEGESVFERRTATLQGGHSDLRAICCGAQVFDIDCQNGDPRIIDSLAEQTALSHNVPTWIDYVECRSEYIEEICELHDGCDEKAAKRLPNMVGNIGTYNTFLQKNNLKEPPGGLKDFAGKKCKAFLPEEKCRRDEPNAARELKALQQALFVHPRFKDKVEAERERLVREKRKPRHKHDASIWSTCIMQASENEILSIIDRTLFDLGWDVWALIFDGLMAAPSADCTEPDIKKAIAAAQEACRRAGWKVVLDDKPLHGLQDKMPKTIAKARDALETWGCLQAGAEP